MATITMRPQTRGSSTETIVANAAGSTAPRFVVGPPEDPTKYGGKVQGRYILETGTTYRWIEDYPLHAAATLSRAVTADNI